MQLSDITKFGSTIIRRPGKWSYRVLMSAAILAVPAGLTLAFATAQSSDIYTSNSNADNNGELINLAPSSPGVKPNVKPAVASTTTDSAGAGDAASPPVHTQTTVVSSSSSNGQSSVTATVNGKPINLPDNGTVHQTITSGNTVANIQAEKSQNSTGSSSSFNISISSSPADNAQKGGGQ